MKRYTIPKNPALKSIESRMNYACEDHNDVCDRICSKCLFNALELNPSREKQFTEWEKERKHE